MVSDPPAAAQAAVDEDEDGDLLIVQVAPEAAGGRLDKTLAALVSALSRARIQSLLADGAVTRDGSPVRDGSAKALAGAYEILVPAVISAEPAAQDLRLTVLFEDSHLIVIDKAAGMAVHPAPGTPDGTVVNALLHHCGESLSGIGGVARPGIVHRLDKDTSGVLVCAKTDAAHQGLSALFFRHDIDRAYVALTRGAPKPRKGVVQSRLGRSAHDRKKMAVLRTGGREAITHYETTELFGPSDRPTAARVRCRLETGRTHQIRVHMASKGAPCLGDAIYGSGSPAPGVRAAMAEAGLTRQALHAAVLGFVHPITGEPLRFESPLPADMARLQVLLGAL
ncbi:MAG: RluA family pseudouridine synthase [Phenylobacterium sp.]|uniref:RluA family pseudouridine synthase n=1 Tax=Phenylobacterium sp. TaxID=1871053 RepID=UPI002728A21E|nr:RluA family pseudouridine synthase [Phenylobacterium sp.]MDO8900697.1 RluA family pseudouridine synthase [Phenylobacterium sp.]MDP2215307.1 RluA family pseudouridine synthase [Phenylobacterium sp.]